MKKRLALILCLIAVLFLCFVGCGDSTLLTGTWTNSTDTIVFNSDNTFEATVASVGSGDTLIGSWSRTGNVITFQLEDARVLVSEFETDIGILTLTWCEESGSTPQTVTLYRTGSSAS